MLLLLMSSKLVTIFAVFNFRNSNLNEESVRIKEKNRKINKAMNKNYFMTEGALEKNMFAMMMMMMMMRTNMSHREMS